MADKKKLLWNHRVFFNTHSATMETDINLESFE